MTAQLKMIIAIELVGVDGVRQRREIADVKRSVDEARLNDFGLSLEETKEIQLLLQKELTQFQADQAARHDRKCRHCNIPHQIHDYRSRTIYSLFGPCRVRVPRWRRCECGQSARSETDCVATLLNGSATPELERIQAELGSRLSFREAARVLDIFLPTAKAHNHRTLSNRLAKVANQLEKWDVASPYRMSRAGKSPVSVFIDRAYIRAVPGYLGRHFEIAMGRVVAQGRAPRPFAGAPNIATGKHDIVRAAMCARMAARSSRQRNTPPHYAYS